MNRRAVSGAIIGAGVGYRRGAAVGAATGVQSWEPQAALARPLLVARTTIAALS
jgi:hypothetical protein